MWNHSRVRLIQAAVAICLALVPDWPRSELLDEGHEVRRIVANASLPGVWMH